MSEIIEKYSKNVIKFLAQPQIKDLLNKSDFEELYKQAQLGLFGIETCAMTQMLYQFVDPIANSDKVFSNFLYMCPDIVDLNIDYHTVIDESAFRSCPNLQTVTLSGVERIGREAFSSCLNLQTLIVNSQNVYLDKRSFSNCPKLDKVIFNCSYLNIDRSAFRYCSSLVKIVYTGTLSDFNNMCSINTLAFGDKSITIECSDRTIQLDN